MNPESRTVVLLGAGASYDAGLPLSVALTRRIVDEIAGDPGRLHRPEARALHMAIGAIVAHDTANGAGAFDGVDVERLFSAVEMLADRPNLEVAPFVSQWIGGLQGLSSRPRFPSDRDFDRAAKGEGMPGLGPTVRKAVEALTDDTNADSVFQSLRASMIDSLRNALVCDSEKLGYLTPLLHSPVGGSQIATLNYDLTVETCAAAHGVELDTGSQNWRGGFGWAWNPSAQIRLLKLHGSVDWLLRQSEFGDVGFSKEAIEHLSPTTRLATRWGEENRLGVIFGRRGKLRADGPFTAMLVEFERWLADADELVVVGYSFRDEHINAIVRRRAAVGGLRVRIIDPALADPASVTWSVGGDNSPAWRFRRDLLKSAGMTLDLETGGYQVPEGTLYPVGAGRGLAQVFPGAAPAGTRGAL